MRADKPAVQFNKVLITFVEQALRNMGNQNEVEWVRFADFAELLEAGQVTGIVIKILCKLVPNKHYGLQAVGFDNFSDPFAKPGDTERQCLDLTLVRNLENIIYDLRQSIT